MVDLTTVKTALVTGGAGFIGSYVVNKLQRDYPHLQIVIVDSLTYAADVSRLDPGSWILEEVDITKKYDLMRVFLHFQPEVVIHLAAESHVDNSITNSAPFVLTNVLGTNNILECIVEMGKGGTQPYLLHVSTDEVYGEAKQNQEFVEDDPLRPRNPYSASKAAAEHLVRAYENTHGVRAIITRGSNTYGPGQHAEKFIPATINRILSGSPVTVYGRGLEVREWLYAEDHAAGILTGLLRGVPGDTFNIGSGIRGINNDVVSQLRYVGREAFGAPEGNVVFIDNNVSRPGHDSRYAVNSSKLRALGWGPSYKLGEHSSTRDRRITSDGAEHDGEDNESSQPGSTGPNNPLLSPKVVDEMFRLASKTVL